MAGASLLSLLDDISTLLDDVAILTKVAGKKTIGVLGDDLALNAEQVTGVTASRELPIVWKVFKGSLLNKLILVPLALAISQFIPWLVTPLLMLGGLFLCFEGFEKLAHKLLHSKDDDDAHHKALLQPALEPDVDMAEFERTKVRGAIRTDFILSAEIIAITLGVVAGAELGTRIVVLSVVALAMTIGVYGLVAAIVKLDDLGLWMSKRSDETAGARLWRATGRGILRLAPLLMKLLSILGTAAMFLVGGGILVHGSHWLETMLHGFESALQGLAAVGPWLGYLIGPLFNGLVGIIAGGMVVAIVTFGRKLMPASAAGAASP